MTTHDRIRHAVVLVAVCCSLCSLPQNAQSADEPQQRPDPSWQISVKQKTLLNSHTSYEFGNPEPPYQKPLSRLEFPVDSAWGGLEVRKQISRFSIGAEFLTSITDQETGRFKDSDWDDDKQPKRLTSYGETSCRLLPSYQAGVDIDMQAADLLRLPTGFDLRPVLGFRWQQLSLVAHDGTQYEYDIPGLPPVIQPLPGKVIAFEQNWYQYFLGMRLGYEWKNLSWLQRLKVQTQLDWSYVKGENRDRHLLRGNRISDESTTGDAWHASLGVLFGITRNLDMGLEGDYLRIQTTGTHTLRDEGTVEYWTSGVKVWSEQYGVTLKLGYRF